MKVAFKKQNRVVKGNVIYLFPPPEEKTDDLSEAKDKIFAGIKDVKKGTLDWKIWAKYVISVLMLEQETVSTFDLENFCGEHDIQPPSPQQYGDAFKELVEMGILVWAGISDPKEGKATMAYRLNLDEGP